LAKPGQNYVKEESQLVITFLSPAMYNLLFALNLPIENFYDSINRLKIIFSWIHSRFHVNVSAWWLGATPVTAAMQQQTISFFAPLTGGIMSHLAVAVDSVFFN
jgi:hypothetical protein